MQIVDYVLCRLGLDIQFKPECIWKSHLIPGHNRQMVAILPAAAKLAIAFSWKSKPPHFYKIGMIIYGKFL